MSKESHVTNEISFPPQDGLASFIRGVTTTVEDAMRKNETMDGIGIEEIRAVGSHRKGTILAGHGVGDVVVVFSEWPTCKRTFFH